MRGKIIAHFCDGIKRLHATTALHHYCSTSLHQWTNSYWASSWCLCASRYLCSLSANERRRCFFVCGSDEHGVAISIRAKKEGKTPKEIIDHYHNMIQSSFDDFGISFDHYGRTSDPIHHQTASDFFKALYDKGDFIEETTEQLYDQEAEQFLADRFVVGTCPHCGHEEAYGDQCESCGRSLNTTDLIHPTSTISGSVPITKATKHWFLPLDRFQSFFEDWILKGHADDWKSNVYGQVKSWLDDGLSKWAVTRDLDWGIPVPVPGENKVLYVWFDAPIDISLQPKIGDSKQYRLGAILERQKHQAHPLYRQGQYRVSLYYLSFDAKGRGSYVLPTNVPANEFLNLERTKTINLKKLGGLASWYLEDFPQTRCVALCLNCQCARK